MSDYEPPMPIMKAVAASISQSTGQNVRKRAEQDGQVQEMHADMVKAVCGRRSDYPEDVFRAYLKRHILEAEARGAAEQRRKDAEAQEIAGYIPENTPNFFSASEAKYASTALHRNPFPNDVPVYYRPANVAALEAEIAELEGERDRYRKCMTDCVELLGRTKPGTLARIWLQDCLDTARAALTREGGV